MKDKTVTVMPSMKFKKPSEVLSTAEAQAKLDDVWVQWAESVNAYLRTLPENTEVIVSW